MKRGAKRKAETLVEEKNDEQSAGSSATGNMAMCRLCLETGKSMKPIMRVEADEFMAKRIFECTSIDVLQEREEENFPKSICEDCRINIERCHSFRQFCLKNDQTLKNLVRILSPTTKTKQIPMRKAEEQPRETGFASSSKVFKHLEEVRDRSKSRSRKQSEDSSTRMELVDNSSCLVEEKEDNARLIAKYNENQQFPKLKKLAIIVPRRELPKRSKNIETEKRLVISLKPLDINNYNMKYIQPECPTKEKPEISPNLNSTSVRQNSQPNIVLTMNALKQLPKQKIGPNIPRTRGRPKPSGTVESRLSLIESKNERALRKKIETISVIDSDDEGGNINEEAEFIIPDESRKSLVVETLKKRTQQITPQRTQQKIPLQSSKPEQSPQSRMEQTPQTRIGQMPQTRIEQTPQSRIGRTLQTRMEQTPQTRIEQTPQSRMEQTPQPTFQTKASLKAVPLLNLLDDKRESPLSSIETAFISAPPEISTPTVSIPMTNFRNMLKDPEPIPLPTNLESMANVDLIQAISNPYGEDQQNSISPSIDNQKQKEKKECEICHVMVTHMYQHKRNKHSQHKYVCQLCHRNFATPIALDKHTECHVKRQLSNQSGKFTCEICNLQFLSHTHQYEHMNSIEHQMNFDLTIAEPGAIPEVITPESNSLVTSDDMNPMIYVNNDPVLPQMPSTPSSTRSVQYQSAQQQTPTTNYGQPLDFMTQENAEFYHIVRQLSHFEATP